MHDSSPTNLISFPPLAELRRRETMKWLEYPAEVLPLWVAESDFNTCPAVREALVDAVARQQFGYPPHQSELGAATAEFHQRNYGWAPAPELIATVPDVVRGVQVALELLVAPAAPVIIPLPSYPPFLAFAEATGRQLLHVSATETGIDLAEVEACFKQGAKAMVLCNPYNPLGLVFSRDWLQQLAHLAAKYDARVLVDEIHAPLVYEGKHVPMASIDEVAAQVCVTVTATSKAWNIAGLKCAQVLFSNEADAKKWFSTTNLITGGESILGITAAIAAYRDQSDFLPQQRAYLQANRDFLLEKLPQVLPGVKTSHPAATYLLWADCSATKIAAVAPQGNISAWLNQHAGIAVNDGAFFGDAYRQFIRINFACERATLELALDRITQAVAKL